MKLPYGGGEEVTKEKGRGRGREGGKEGKEEEEREGKARRGLNLQRLSFDLVAIMVVKIAP